MELQQGCVGGEEIENHSIAKDLMELQLVYYWKIIVQNHSIAKDLMELQLGRVPLLWVGHHSIAKDLMELQHK